MIEFRQDPLKKTIVIISGARAKRPFVFDVPKGSCFFCKGMEFTTPPTTFALPDEKNWKVRSFRNAFPILSQEEKFTETDESERGYYYATGFGEHEVIVESDDHAKLFQQLSDEELKMVWKAYCHRFNALIGHPEIKAVLLFKNHGKRAGASIEHEHSQIISLPIVPEIESSELDRQKKNKKAKDSCNYCKLAEFEKANTVFETENFSIIAVPFARFSYEVWIVPKKHITTMLELKNGEGLELMQIIKRLALKAEAIAPDYNVIYHNSPKGSDLHFHIEFFPRTSDWAGLELGAGIIVRSKTEQETIEKYK